MSNSSRAQFRRTKRSKLTKSQRYSLGKGTRKQLEETK